MKKVTLKIVTLISALVALAMAAGAATHWN
jgi:flagellar basal body-associated protein FliL